MWIAGGTDRDNLVSKKALVDPRGEGRRLLLGSVQEQWASHEVAQLDLEEYVVLLQFSDWQPVSAVPIRLNK